MPIMVTLVLAVSTQVCGTWSTGSNPVSHPSSILLLNTKLLINTVMQKLYIAGDSFASLANNQPVGNSWSEILASDLSLDLINVARPASSNFSIALQIEWIIDRITPDDFLIVFLNKF